MSPESVCSGVFLTGAQQTAQEAWRLVPPHLELCRVRGREGHRGPQWRELGTVRSKPGQWGLPEMELGMQRG